MKTFKTCINVLFFTVKSSIYCKESTSYSTFGDLGKLLTMRKYLKLKTLWFQFPPIVFDFETKFILKIKFAQKIWKHIFVY